ncbi:Arginyl-tRNA--protein transferase 1 [Marasmius tenuissimus]|uniref:arginyltransferase n=1 Tax=Marasmius tenuissimus TaxID=585030 RepID=A0ABR3ABX6_9AGAR
MASVWYSSSIDSTKDSNVDIGHRTGTWCYKPDLKASCCPQYPIRLDVTKFKPSRSQRQLVNRWNRFIEHGKEDGKKNAKSKGKHTTNFDLIEHLHASEHSPGEKDGWAHRFEIILEPSSFTNEKYELFEKYQTNIHHDSSTRSGFKRFLVESPLRPEPIPYSSHHESGGRLPTNYGSYHQLYRLDGKLIAMAVLDILPSCVSSVYFMYDDEWDAFSLGKLSALREISLASELHRAGAPGLSFVYLGT